MADRIPPKGQVVSRFVQFLNMATPLFGRDYDKQKS